MASDLVAQVKQAYDALGGQIELRKSANEWLMDFERSPSAWEVAHKLLLEPFKSPYRFFGANILHNKIRQDFEQLNGESGNDLRRALIQNLIQMANEPEIEKAVCQRLCLCVSALALQLNQKGIIPDILSSLNSIVSTAPLIILELLTVLPEECYDCRVNVHPNTRDLFSVQLCESANDVFAFLQSLYSPSENTALTTTRNQIICCVSVWIDNVQITEEFLSHHTLFLICVDALQYKELFECAVDLIICTLRRYRSLYDRYTPQKSAILASIILPRVLAMKSFWNQKDVAENNQDDDLYRSLCRLFTETGEAYSDLLVNDTSLQTYQEEIFSQILECVRFPWDFEIARIPLQFFYELSVTLTDENCRYFLSYPIQQFIPLYNSLLQVCLEQMLLDGATVMGIERIDEEKLRQREDLIETVRDCCVVLGGQEALQQVCTVIQKELEKVSLLQHQSKEVPPDQWCLLESCLHGIQIIAGYVSPSEEVVLPQLMNVLPTLPNVSGVTLAVIEIIGKFANWISWHASYVNPLFGQLLGYLAGPTTSEAAAHAIMELCIGCANIPDLPMKLIHEQLLHLRQTGGLSLRSELDVLEGLCKVISGLPPQQCLEALRFIVEPIAHSLSDNLEAGKSPVLKDITSDVDRLTATLRFTSCPSPSASEAPSSADVTPEENPVLSVFLLVWPLLRHVLGKYTIDHVTEKVCRCYKHIIRNVRLQFHQCLECMLADLVEHFNKTQNASFLYTGAICFSEFGTAGDGRYVELLMNMMWQFSDTFFSKFTSLSDFEQRPDVVEEYFYLLARVLQTVPEPLVTSPQARVLVQAGITGLRLNQREAQKGILFFFERVVSLPTEMQSHQAVQTAVNALLSEYAQPLVFALFYCLSGCLPAYAVDENQGSIGDVLWGLKTLTPEGLGNCITQILPTLPSYCQEEATRLKIPQSVVQAPRRRDFTDVLDKFEKQCRKRTQT